MFALTKAGRLRLNNREETKRSLAKRLSPRWKIKKRYNFLNIPPDWPVVAVNSLIDTRRFVRSRFHGNNERAYGRAEKSNPFPAQIVYVLFKGLYVFVRR